MHPALSIPFIGMNECIHEEYSKKGLATSRRSVKSANNAGLCALCQMIPGIGEGKQELHLGKHAIWHGCRRSLGKRRVSTEQLKANRGHSIALDQHPRTLRTSHATVDTSQTPVHTLHTPLGTSHFTVSTPHCAHHIQHFTPHTLHGTLHTQQSTRSTSQLTLST